MSKQISKSQAAKIAKRRSDWRLRHEACAEDWIKENAKFIALANLPGACQGVRNLFGEWPKGWKAELKKQAEERAVQEWIAKNCKVIEGVIWCMDWQTIQELEGGTE